MKIELLGYTPDPDFITGMAAFLTHSELEGKLLKKMDKKQIKNILDTVIKMGHTSVVEHSLFIFSISDVSRVLTHQLVRHRIASYSQQSQRYVKLSTPQYITPPSITQHTDIKKQYDKIIRELWTFYQNVQKKGIPLEDARYILPNATHSNIIVSMNARSLLNFFDLRCCLYAQWEIRKLAYKMLKLVTEVAPVIFSNAGPSCKTKNICPMDKKKCKWYPK
jgi:thymidylate synthase (FAD)